MRKIKLQIQITIDSFIAGRNGEMDWVTWNWDEGLNKYVHDLINPVDCILLGRKLAEGFIPTWKSRLDDPKTADDFARKMVDTDKIVFSKTLNSNNWENTSIENGELNAAITKLKQTEGGDIIVYGGGNFVSNLIKNNLIDEYHIFVNPVAIGKGMPIFSGLENNLKLNLKATKQFECGIVVCCYQPNN